MERKELNVSKRDIGKGVSRRLRREKRVPAILYGANSEPLAISVDRLEMDHTLNTDAGWNILLDLNVDGKEKILTRISDYQTDVMSRQLKHLVFQILDLNKKIRTEVPIRLTGKAEGVKEGGIMEQIRRSLDIRCLPTNIPGHIDYDVSHMVIGDSIHVDDLKLPEGVECAHETNFSIAAVVAPTKIVEPEAPVEGEAVLAEGEVGAAPAEGEAAEGGKKDGAPEVKKEDKGKGKGKGKEKKE